MKTISLILGMLLTSIIINAQAPNTEWQKNYGGTGTEYAYSIKETSDSGYILAGFSYSNDGDIIENKGNSDFCIIKLNNTNDIIWQKTYGGTDSDFANSIQETTDGGYIVAGYTYSNDGDIPENKGDADFWIIKLNNIGDTIWHKTYGGTDYDYEKSIKETTDGGYIVIGYTKSNDGDITENKGNEDVWVIKLDNIGDIIWQKTYGGTNNDEAFSIQETTDGGYIFTGNTESNDGDITENKGNKDVWVIKLDNTGGIIWQKTYGGASNDEALSIQEITNGEYIVAGYTESNNGDITENKGEMDAWLIKIDNTGNIIWQKTYGGTSNDDIKAMQETTDSGFILAGNTKSNDGNITENKGYTDVWLIKVNNIGDIIWQKTYGGSNSDLAFSIQETSNEGYIVAGYTDSNNGDITENKGAADIWVIKIGEDTLSNYVKQLSYNIFSIYPNPTTGKVQISLNEQQVGSTLQITDINGRVVKQLTIEQLNTLTIDLSNQAKGVYFVKLISESGVSTQKVVLE